MRDRRTTRKTTARGTAAYTGRCGATRCMAIARAAARRETALVAARRRPGRGGGPCVVAVSRSGSGCSCITYRPDRSRPGERRFDSCDHILTCVPTWPASWCRALIARVVSASHRFYLEVSSQFVISRPGVPLDRAIVFPLAVVPNVWGPWNMLHLALSRRVRLSLALHGALLPLVLIPAGFTLARLLDVFTSSGCTRCRWSLEWPSTICSGSIWSAS